MIKTFRVHTVLFTIIACVLAGCQSSPLDLPRTSPLDGQPLPTRVLLPTEAVVLSVTPLPTRALRQVTTASPVVPAAGEPVPQPASVGTPLVLEPSVLAPQPTGLPALQPSEAPAIAPAGVTPIFTPFAQSVVGSPNIVPAAPLNSAAPLIVTPTLPASIPARADSLAFTTSTDYIFGASVQGRTLVARIIGQGDTALMFVGAIHGGWEANTAQLVSELIAYFEANPEQILPGIRLILIPVLNPDGLILGRTLEGRFNANGVDLNRNWGCDWAPTAVFRDTPVNPGASAFSEPESVALAAYIVQVRPAVVLFYHSAANGIFAGDCVNGGVSDDMSALYGAAAEYSFGAAFTSYPVTGTAATWVDGIGIPSADVELQTTDSTDFMRNLAGIMALQCWALGEAAAALPACAPS